MDSEKPRADHAEAMSITDNNLKESSNAADPPFTLEQERKVLRKSAVPKQLHRGMLTDIGIVLQS